MPILICLFGFSQHSAQGTMLAMLVQPRGLLAALVYYRQGYVNLTVAGLLCLGLVTGGFLGVKFAVGLIRGVYTSPMDIIHEYIADPGY